MDQLYIKSGIKYPPTSADTIDTLQQPYYDVEEISQELLEYKEMQVAIRYEVVEEEHITYFSRQILKSSNVLKVNNPAEIHILDDNLKETTERLKLDTVNVIKPCIKENCNVKCCKLINLNILWKTYEIVVFEPSYPCLENFYRRVNYNWMCLCFGYCLYFKSYYKVFDRRKFHYAFFYYKVK